MSPGSQATTRKAAVYQSESGPVEPLADYRLEGTTVNYSQFLPRL